MRQFFASIWPVDVFESANWPTNLKLYHLAQIAAAAYENAMTAAANLGVNKPIVLFAAPEYYFVKAIAPGGPAGQTWTLYEENEKNDLLAELKGIAKQHYRMVFVPGSIAWRRARQVPHLHNTRTNNYDGFNTTPIFYKTNLHHTYDKKFDDGTCRRFTTDVLFSPGVGSQLFRVEGRRCGIEVCGDINDQNLANEAAPASLDVEVFISATNPHDFTTQLNAVPVRNGGYFVHCDASVGNESGLRRNGVWVIQRGGGWHGTPQIQGGGIDPWTMQRLRDDSTGLELSYSSVLQLRYQGSVTTNENQVRPRRNSLTRGSGGTTTLSRERRSSFTSGYSKPTPPPNLSLDVDLELRPEYGLGSHGLGPDSYSVQVVVKLSVPTGSQASVAEHLVGFTVDHGVVTPASVTTDQSGTATARVTLQRTQKATIRATVKTAGNAYIDATSEIVGVGSGSVSKLSSLKPLKHTHVPCWFLPM
ncbi:MAG TPA: Ig-like domain-containing protein [Gemmatimonadaceae bacterium]|nr:Ig-like domain-containing protein [Gemmatimonadaceae bacterium]